MVEILHPALAFYENVKAVTEKTVDNFGKEQPPGVKVGGAKML